MARDSRLFAQFDLDYADHPKIGDLSDAAFRAHVEMILYARKYLTDGLIPKRVANRFGFESLSELMNNDPESPSLLDNGDGTYTLHGYADMNETRADVEGRKRRNSANGRRGGRPKKTQSVTESVTESGTESQTQSGTQKKAETETETETDREVSKETSTRKARGSRLDPKWVPSPDLIEQMRAECPDVNLEGEHRVFVDYWVAQPGQKGVKVDWPATWRNWMRRKRQDRPYPSVQQQSKSDEAQDFISRLEAMERGAHGGGEVVGDRPQLR